MGMLVCESLKNQTLCCIIAHDLFLLLECKSSAAAGVTFQCADFFFRHLKRRFTIWRRDHAGRSRTAWKAWSTLFAARCTCQTSAL